MKTKDMVLAIAIFTVMSLFSNAITTKASSAAAIINSIPGLCILAIIALAGMIAAKFIPGGIPAAAWVVTIGCLVTVPGFPGAEFINAKVKLVNFVALCTPILAYAGISIGKDLDAFQKTGWRIVVLACAVFIGTYLASAVIAQFILKALGQI
ncbi:MAG: DUF340 domain-containing protein [Phascolarctobacterium sp.]|nr:DUF340 domain-containing protein [Phascolarctobacterium sp.]